MLNDKIIKTNNETCLKRKYPLKQVTLSREKVLPLLKSDKTHFLKIGLKFSKS